MYYLDEYRYQYNEFELDEYYFNCRYPSHIQFSLGDFFQPPSSLINYPNKISKRASALKMKFIEKLSREIRTNYQDPDYH